MKYILCIVFFLINGICVAFEEKWNSSLELSITRCFKRKSVTFQCNDFSEKNPLKTKAFQELEIIAIDFYGRKRSYGYGKAIEGNLCRVHFKKIKQLIHMTDQVCITGDDEVSIGVNETFSRWKELESIKGKVSF